MKYLFLAVSAMVLTACQQGPLVKSKPFDVEKAIARNAERNCRNIQGAELYAKCFDREVAKGRSDVKMIEAHFRPKKR